MYNICLLCVDTNVKYIVEKNNFNFRLKPKEMYFNRCFLLSAINLGEKDK